MATTTRTSRKGEAKGTAAGWPSWTDEARYGIAADFDDRPGEADREAWAGCNTEWDFDGPTPAEALSGPAREHDLHDEP